MQGRKLYPAVKVAGRVEAAYFCEEPPFAQRRKSTGARAKGVRYEKKVQAYLQSLDPLYLPSPWLRFLDESGWRWCQPDGIRIDAATGELLVVEVKYQHTQQAWEQMEKLYAPVLRFLFPGNGWRLRFLEVVKWYDCDTPCTPTPRLIEHPFQQQYERGLHIWRP